MDKQTPTRKTLRRARIAASVIIFLMVTLLWTEYSSLMLRRLGWVSKVQMLPVAFGLSTGVILFWLLVSVMFGRIYCSSICPLGTWLDAAARLRNRIAPRRYRHHAALTAWRYGSLAVFTLSILMGLMIVPLLIEPYTVYTRFLTATVKPVWGHINNTLAAVGTATGWWALEEVVIVKASLVAVALSIATMTAITTTGWMWGRLFCNTVCPVGNVLGIASARAVWHIDIDTDLCTHCGRCEDVCKASCINLRDHVVDSSRCVSCFNCLTACRDNAIFYRPSRKQLSMPMMQATTAPPTKIPSLNITNHETIS